MSLMGDHQTGSYWDHVTGECLHGPLKGRRLELEPLRHMRADQALAQFPDAQIARSRLPLPFGLAAGLMKVLARLTRGRFLPPRFAGSMGEEDPRRPRLEMGLGVWTERVSRYYPLEVLKAGERRRRFSSMGRMPNGMGATCAWKTARSCATAGFTIPPETSCRPNSRCTSLRAGTVSR